MNTQKQFLSPKGKQMLFFVIAWLFLAAWSLSAFWEHIDALKPSYQFAAKAGAAGAEVILLILIYQKCYSIHIGVRKWAIILGFLFAAFILVHSAALRGIGEAEVKQIQIEDRIAEKLGQLSTEQATAIGTSNAQTSGGLSQKERLANQTKTKSAQADVMKGAQEKLVNEISSRSEKIKETAIFPKWYLNGWMYGALFIAGLLCMCITGWLSMNKEDIDEDFDGKPDQAQLPKREPVPPQVDEAEWEEFQRFRSENARPGKETRH